MKSLLSAVVALGLLAIAAFCVFGFLASFEGNTTEFIAFRIGYVAVGLGCLMGVGFLLVSGGSRSDD